MTTVRHAPIPPIKSPEGEALCQRIAATWRTRGKPAAEQEFIAEVQAKKLVRWVVIALSDRIRYLACEHVEGTEQ